MQIPLPPFSSVISNANSFLAFYSKEKVKELKKTEDVLHQKKALSFFTYHTFPLLSLSLSHIGDFSKLLLFQTEQHQNQRQPKPVSLGLKFPHHQSATPSSSARSTLSNWLEFLAFSAWI
jgi:hypothetical protein